MKRKGSFTGKKHTEETKRKMSLTRRGNNHPFFGRKHSEETRIKIRLARAKQVITPESNKKRSNTLKRRKFCKERLEKMKQGFQKGNKTKSQFKKGHKGYTYWKGKKRSEETKEKISKANKGKRNSIKTEFKKGNKVLKNEEWIKNQANSLRDFYKTKKGMDRREKISEVMKRTRINQIFPKKDTSIEIKIRKFLDELKIEYFQHKYINIKHSYQCDFFIPSLNLVIEADGDYWHKYPVGRDIDHIRTKELLKKGFRVLRLWEFEIKEMDLNNFKEKLK